MERTVTVVPEAGLHARPAAAFVRTANEFDATVEIGRAGAAETVDARSMLSVTALGVEHGDEVRLVAEGDDAGAALDALEAVLSTPEEGEADADDGGTPPGDGDDESVSAGGEPS
ncbi:HPr family phosphocarrier protein [Halobaculum lipolyticum]|uniref:HPr family phosphocarrier protein n=1 Tax=Halobaculum lipolyticum TaxID=3032001 RepID=A0ABD5WKJ9_9EURY|nr:HPr family phosphocarrier protein [Halobaculum sp. DT31]